MLIEFFEKARNKVFENKRLMEILCEGSTAPFFLEEVGDNNEWMSLEQLKWLGFEVTPDELLSLTRQDLIKMYGEVNIVHSRREANLAIEFDFDPNTMATVYQKLIKLSNGKWYTLHEVWKYLIKAPDGPAEDAILMKV